MNRKGATIIPVAAGKGGVGKTFLAASLGIAIAESGYRTILVDLDLGGSNLHDFLGLPNRFPGVGDFLKARVAELHELQVPTVSPNLKFIPGDGRTPFMANIPYAQKERLISHIRTLPADYVLLDLGAGSSLNTLDFFRISPRGLIVTTPEYPAIIRMMAFLKHVSLRDIERYLAGDRRIMDTLKSLYKEPMRAGRITIEEVRKRVAAIDPEAGEGILEACRSRRPRLVFNMGVHPREMAVSDQISRSLETILSIEVDYFGFLLDDPLVRESVRGRRVFLSEYPESATGKGIFKIAERILKYWETPVADSARLIYRHAMEVYDIEV